MNDGNTCKLDPAFRGNHSRKDIVALDDGKLFKHLHRLGFSAVVNCI